jgi:hypothetical protein
MVIVAAIAAALGILAFWGTLGIGGSVVTWTMTQILSMVALGVAGIAFLGIGIWLLWANRKRLTKLGIGNLKSQIPIMIPFILILIGVMFLNPGAFGSALTPIFNIAFFIIGLFLVVKFIIPALEGKLGAISDVKLAGVTVAVMFFFILGIPGVVLSFGGNTFAMSAEGAAIADVEGPNFLAPVMSIGGMIWADNPAFGLFLIAAVIGLAGAFILKDKKWRS